MLIPDGQIETAGQQQARLHDCWLLCSQLSLGAAVSCPWVSLAPA